MTVALFDPRVRWILAAIAVGGLVVALLARRRGAPRLTTLALCAVFGALGVVAAEALVALTVRVAAPASVEFNEHRWVLLAPWRRRGLWLGAIAVTAIAALGWRASRGATPLRRAAMVSLLTGGRFIKTYDQEYCGDRDNNGNTTGNSTVCLGRIPFAFDLSVSYGMTARIELMFDMRLGVERDFGGSVTDSDGPRLRHYAPGVKFYFSDSGVVKFFSTAQLAIDDTGYTSPTGDELGTDVSIRNANGLHLDFHEAYGAFAFFAEDVAFRRWISVGVEFGVGFQGRYP